MIGVKTLHTGCYYKYEHSARSTDNTLYFKVTGYFSDIEYAIKSSGGGPLFNGMFRLYKDSPIVGYCVEISILEGLREVGE